MTQMGDKLLRPSLPIYWALYIGVRLLYYLFHIPLSIMSWGKGKTVPPVRNSILLKSATKLAEEIRQGKLKSEEVVQAFIVRIMEVEPYINAVAEDRFQVALEEAKQIDAFIQSGKCTSETLKEEKPLFGVPFTVKVVLTVKGLHSSAACKAFKDIVAEEDAPTVALLREAGAIVLATTNSAELGLGHDTVNPLYGKTCNPYDTHRTPGGSSGGESALLGAAGSVIGLGNDITGSVRIPAHFTGIFAHKPSLGMISNSGCYPIINPKISKFLYTGVMCRYSEDIFTMMNALTSKNQEKRTFGQPINFRKLKIFYMIDIDDPTVLRVDKEISEAMIKAMNHFNKKYGVIAKKIDISLLNLSNELVFNLLTADITGIADMTSAGKDMNMNCVLEFLKFAFGKSNHSLWSIIDIAFGKSPLICKESKIPIFRSVLQELYEKFDELLDENSVFFYPTLPFSAPRCYEMIPLIFSANFTGIFNFLGLPATQCPLGINSHDLPQGMQIIGKMNNDNLTIACAHEISKAFGGWIPPS